jgi:hypothetical protein
MTDLAWLGFAVIGFMVVAIFIWIIWIIRRGRGRRH